MSIESSSETQKSQIGKSASKRTHRASRQRPVLVTEGEGTSVDEQTVQTAEEAIQPAELIAVEEEASTTEKPTRRRVPGFFANIGKTETPTDQPEVDPKAARLARAMRGKSAGVSSKESPVKEKKQSTNVIPARPRSSSGFKMRYIWGMVMYLLIADFLGVYITNFMQAHKADAVLFIWGPIKGTTSTLIFLALLVIILIVMARFDLLPRSFSGMYGGNSATRGATSRSSKAKDAPTFESKAPPPTIRQGVQGEHDDLYREYRKNQRYFQRRDRKR